MSQDLRELNTRIQLKHDTQVNWELIETTFIPLSGELIIYDADGTYSYPRFKVGDGVSYLSQLNFASSVEDIEAMISTQVTNQIADQLRDIVNVSNNKVYIREDLLYSYGTTNLSEGSSQLNSGELYFYYTDN